MKSRISCFNFRVLRKNLGRFAPLWILFTIAEVLGVMTLDLGNYGSVVAAELSYVTGPVAVAHMIYAFLVAACLFGDLFDSRLCNGLHALPLKRSGWMLTNIISGLVFALIPAVVAGGITALFLGVYAWVALAWQLSSFLQFLFFFGLAVFSALCAGKKLGMAAIYAIFNFLSMLIYWIVGIIYEPLLSGVTLSDAWFRWFCPVINMVSEKYFVFENTVTHAVFKGFEVASWQYLFGCAAVGLVFLWLGWRRYRKRDLEMAGDFISFRPMNGVFQIAYTFAMGALIYSIFSDLLGLEQEYGFLIAGLLIGWFTGWMLMERRVKIFHGKMFLYFALFVALFTGSVVLTVLDPAGITTYVPQESRVEKAALYMQHDFYAYESEQEDAFYVTDPAELVQVQQLHQKLINMPEETLEDYIIVYVRYEMKNGFPVLRKYQVPAGSEMAKDLAVFFSDPRAATCFGDWAWLKENLEYAYVYESDGDMNMDILDPKKLEMLMAAMEADCKAGTFAQHDYFHQQQTVYSMQLGWEPEAEAGDVTVGSYLLIYEDCVNTVAFLNELRDNL